MWRVAGPKPVPIFAKPDGNSLSYNKSFVKQVQLTAKFKLSLEVSLYRTINFIAVPVCEIVMYYSYNGARGSG